MSDLQKFFASCTRDIPVLGDLWSAVVSEKQSCEESTKNINASTFDLSKMCDDCTVAIVGKRGTGTGMLAHDLLYHLCDKFEKARSVGAVEAEPYAYCFYDEWKAEEFDAQHLLDLVPKKGEKPSPNLVLFHQAMSPKVAKSTAFRGRLVNAKARRNTTFIIEQCGKSLPVDSRSLVDYVFAARESSASMVRDLWQAYFFFVTLDEFAERIRTLPSWTFLVADRLQEKMYTYRATTDLPTFRLGFRAEYLEQLDKQFAPCAGRDEDEEVQSLREENERLQKENHRLREKLARIRIDASL